MKKTILFLLLFLSGQLLVAQHFDIEFQQCYGGSDTDYPKSILKIDSGFVSLGYSFSNDGDVSFNYGKGDFGLSVLLPMAKSFGRETLVGARGIYQPIYCQLLTMAFFYLGILFQTMVM